MEFWGLGVCGGDKDIKGGCMKEERGRISGSVEVVAWSCASSGHSPVLVITVRADVRDVVM